MMMMLRVAVLVAMASLAAANCLPSCRFHFCEHYTTMALYNRTGQIDVPLTPSICHERKSVGVANSGEAYVSMRDSFVRISSIALNGGRAYIAPHFFKTYTQRRSDTSGVGHQKLQFEEDVALAGRCVALPITHVQIVEEARGNVVENAELSHRMRDCVSFRVRGMGRTGSVAFGVPEAALTESVEPEMSAEPAASAEEQLEGAVMF